MKRANASIAALVVALVVGGVLRFWDLTAHSLFIDEGFTFMVAGKSWPAMMEQIVYHDFHPPLFYIVTHWAIGALHWQFWDYRYLTASCGLVTIAATWAIARRLFGDVAAGVAAVLTAIDPSLIGWDRLYRMYAVMTALAAVSWWLLLVAQERKGSRAALAWTLFAVAAVVQPYIQYLGALNVLFQGIYALGDIRKRWPAIASGAAAACALVPWLWAFKIQYPNGGHVAGTGAIPIYWWGVVRDTIMTGAPAGWVNWRWFDVTATLAAIAIALAGALIGRKTILPFWLAVGASQALLSLATGKSLIVPRYLDHVVPAFCIAAGACVAWIVRTRARVAGVLLGVGLAALCAVSTADLLWDPFYQQPDWYLVNLVVLQHERKSDALLFVQGFPYVVVGDFTAFRNHDVAGPAMPSDLRYTFSWLRKHARQRVWYIENQYFYPDPKKKIKAYLDKTRTPLFIRSEARENAGDVVNVILYSSAHAVPVPGTKPSQR